MQLLMGGVVDITLILKVELKVLLHEWEGRLHSLKHHCSRGYRRFTDRVQYGSKYDQGSMDTELD